MNISQLIQSSFWSEWEDRFMANSDKFITPGNKLVVEEANKVTMQGCCGNQKPVLSVWSYIYRNIEYELSKEWKTPEETIKDGVGDCEDVDFLALSMFPHFGVEQAHLVVGNIKTPVSSGPHTWVEVNGMVVDPTGRKEDVKNAKYDEVTRFTINYE